MTPTATAPVITKYPEIETALIESSGLNPRTHWDKASDAELQESIRGDGVLEPIIVRPHPKKDGRFQIVAGERRFRAAYEVGLELIPAIVRDVTDEKLLELALTENIQRRSMHPLDEANGFIKRLEMGQTTPEQLANTLGLSTRYVTDRCRLKKLNTTATELLETGAITITHAIILAKLNAQQQDEAIKRCTTYELDFESSADQPKPVFGTVADLKEWVSDNVPLNLSSPAAQEEFPELAADVAAAAAAGATIVMLSDKYEPWQYKAKAGDPIFRDGWTECKPTAKGAQVGIIVEGRRRGLKLSWKPVVKATPSNRPASSTSQSSSQAPVTTSAAEQKKRDERIKREAAADKRRREESAFWTKNKAAAFEAYQAHINKAPIKVAIALLAKSLGFSTAPSAEAFVRGVVVNRVKNTLYSLDSFEYGVKGSGFNARQWLKEQKAAAPAKAAKKAKKR